MEVLNYSLEEGLDLFNRCLKKEREDRLYLLWVAYFTNPMGQAKRKSWEEFLEISTGTSDVAPTDTSKVGTIRGVDLAQMKR